MSFDPHEARFRALAMDAHPRLLAVVDEIVGPLTAAGRARVVQAQREDLEPGLPAIRIEPTESAAAGMELTIDGALISLAVGPSLHVHEVPLSAPDWERQVRDAVEAVVLGRYEEFESRGWIADKLVMRFGTRTGDVVMKHALLDGPRLKKGHNRFAPYEPSG